MFARVFKSGNSLALRIPKEFAGFFKGHNVKIIKKHDSLVIEHVENSWDDIFNNCYNPDFPERSDFHFKERESL
jgi:virulence-associated protein VagC